MLEPVEDIDECPSCGSERILMDYERSSIICGKCGKVITDNVKDIGPEWRAFDQEEKNDKSRGGPPMNPMLHDMGLSTKIKKGTYDGKGKIMNPDQKRKAHQLRKWQKRSRQTSSKDRSVSFAITEISKICSQLSLPGVIAKNSANLYREASKNNLIRGRSREGVAAAVIYASCRLMDVPRTMEEIATTSPVDRKEMRRTFQTLARGLDLDIPPVDPVKFVNRFGSILDLDHEVVKRSKEILNKAKEKRLVTGRNPRGVVGACLYLAATENGIDIPQTEIARAVNVTEVTVRNRFREINDELNLGIDV